MTLMQLRYIVAVDRHRHFGRAAESCRVSQPTLSMALRKSEDELGGSLFDRSRKPVVPTSLGLRIIEQSRLVLREHDRLAVIVAEEQEQITGDLTIGVIPTLAPYLLPLITEPFAKQYPGVNLTINEMMTESILEGIASDEIDAGLIATEESLPGMVSVPLFREKFTTYISTNHPLIHEKMIDPEKLKREELWLLGEGHCFRQQILELCGDTDPDRQNQSIHFSGGTLETLRHLVENGNRLTLLPMLATTYLSEQQVKRHIRPLGPVVPERTVTILYGREELKKGLIDRYAEKIRQIIADVVVVDLIKG